MENNQNSLKIMNSENILNIPDETLSSNIRQKQEFIQNLIQELLASQDNFEERIYYFRSQTLELPPKLFDYYCSILPYQFFIEIAFTHENPEIQVIALLCLSDCSNSPHFPVLTFNSPEYIDFLLLALSNRFDTRFRKASINILTTLVSSFPEIRNYLLEHDFLSLIPICPPDDAAFLIHIFLSLQPPLPAITISSFAEIIAHFLNGPPYFPNFEPFEGTLKLSVKEIEIKHKIEEQISSSVIQVIQPALSCILSIISNHNPEEENEINSIIIQFLNELPPYLLSGAPFIVQKSLQILFAFNSLPLEFSQLLLSIIQEEFWPGDPILKLIGNIFAKNLQNGAWNSVAPQIYEVLNAFLDSNSLSVNISFLRALIYTNNQQFSEKLFTYAIKYLEFEEIAPLCMQYIVEIIEGTLSEAENDIVKAIIDENIELIEEKFDNNESLSDFSQRFHAIYDSMN